MLRQIGRISFAAIVLCTMVGCGGNPSVSGTVKLTSGEVLKKGTVQYTSDDITASGMIKEDGTYELSSLGDADGIPPGKYKVSVLGAESGGGYDDPDAPVKMLIDIKYTNAGTTPLEMEVPSESYDLELEPAGE